MFVIMENIMKRPVFHNFFFNCAV